MNNWLHVLDRLSKLKNNSLLAYRIMLEDMRGRMKSLNILDPDMVTIQVVNRTTSESRHVTVPRYTSLWKLREFIGE